MFSFLKGASFWLWLGIIALYTSGVSLMAYNKGLNKGLDRIGTWQQETAEALVKAMNTEHERQMKFIEEREPIIQEKITYLDRVKTEYETIIRENPSSPACFMPAERVRGYNSIR